MKRAVLLVLPALLCACASPRYSYNFDYYDYNEGRPDAKPTRIAEFSTNELNNNELVADASGEYLYLAETTEATNEVENKISEKSESETKQVSQLSRSERRELKRELKQAIKEYRKLDNQVASGPETVNEMDNDLKMAIIFGAVGLTLSLFAGINAAFWVLGVIAIVVGVVFLVRWLLRQ